MGEIDKSDIFEAVELSIKEILNTSNITHAEMIAILELIKHEILHSHDDQSIVMVSK